MRYVGLIVSGLFLLGCAAEQLEARATPPPQSEAQAPASPQPGAAAEEPDGSSYARAILIEAPDERAGVALEYRWLAKQYPRYLMRKQGLRKHEQRAYDVIDFTDASGTARQIYFDITSFFGKR